MSKKTQWTVDLHEEVDADLRALGTAEARAILAAIEERIAKGSPDIAGKALGRELAGCRRIRVGSTRIVYRVDKGKVHVLIIAIGVRRDSEVYEAATKRLKVVR